VADPMLVATLLLVIATSETPQNPSAVEAELKRTTQELLDAVAPGDRAVWDRYLDERVIHVDESGIVRTKAEVLKEITPLPQGLIGSINILSFRTVVHDDVAVADA
jgi:hypothetical protein